MKWILGVFSLLILGMIYWSSLLIEKDIKKVHQELNAVKNEIKKVQFSSQQQTSALSQTHRPHIEGQYPNLLKEDPFFIEILPKLIGQGFTPKGIRREALLGKPEHLHPFNHFKDISSFWSLCTLSLADNQFGKYEAFSPAAAIKIEERPSKNGQSKEYWVHLREGIYWEPLRTENFPSSFALNDHFLKKHPLTSHDYKFYFDAVMNPHVSEPKAASLRTYYGDIEEFEVLDDLTFVVRWKGKQEENSETPKIKYTAFSLTCSLHPLPCFLFQHFADGKKIVEDDSNPETYRSNSIWAQNFTHHFAKNIIPSCGAWIFWQMNDEGIVFKRNPSYFQPFAVLVEELQYSFKQTAEAIWQELKTGSIDLCQLTPTQLPELERFIESPIYKMQCNKGMPLKEIEFVEPSYYYIGWNQKTPYFADRNVRLAMTMSIDRDKIISQNLNEMGIPISGPFFCYSPSYDSGIAPWPFQPEEAKRLLCEEGWVDNDGDGIREKEVNGRRIPFVFSLIYYAKNLSTKAICEYVATALREVGIQANIKGLDITDLSHSFEDKSFDAIFFGWGLGSPPEDPRQLWYSSGSNEKGSSNAVGFSNSEADKIIDELQYEDDKEKRLQLYHRFHRIIHEEAPYTFLYSPKRQLLYRDYIKNVFIPRERQDLCPGAVIPEPDLRVLYVNSPGDVACY